MFNFSTLPRDRLMHFGKLATTTVLVVGGVLGGILVVSYCFYKIITMPSTPMVTHFQLNDAFIDRILKYQPFVEACAGNGKNAQKLKAKGADIISYDIIGTKVTDYTVEQLDEQPVRVHYGKNGDFEDKYPDRILLIFCGYSIEDSISKYTGKTVIIGGYYLPESRVNFGRTEYRVDQYRWRYFKYNNYLLPEPEWMEANGWTCIDTMTTNNSTPERYTRDFIIKIYERTETKLQARL